MNYNNNIEKIKERNILTKDSRKEYYNINKNKILEKMKIIQICNCGCQYTHNHYSRHCKTKKHLEFIKNQVV